MNASPDSNSGEVDFSKLPADIQSKYLVVQEKKTTKRTSNGQYICKFEVIKKNVLAIKKEHYCNCCGVIFGDALIALYGSSIANTQRSIKFQGRCVPCETAENKIKKTCILCGEHKGDLSLEWYTKYGQLCGKCIPRYLKNSQKY